MKSWWKTVNEGAHFTEDVVIHDIEKKRPFVNMALPNNKYVGCAVGTCGKGFTYLVICAYDQGLTDPSQPLYMTGPSCPENNQYLFDGDKCDDGLIDSSDD
ncbi:unnamed protein product [Strongylus vulgaris]|uniref:SCP domain-containing protein n=1 Tax=Strongylus vulgaris TaxID=40348 RepID=A0A3P7JF88_STRVU|nr:unnamed protein product [Strongylus vulgaris]